MATTFHMSSADLLESTIRGLVNPASCGGSYNGTEIDYWSFSREAVNLTEGACIRCEVTDGSEGTWINVYALPDLPTAPRYYVGCVKTLEYSEKSWTDMGALAGAISYRAEKALWKAYRAAVRAARAAAET